MGAIGAYAPEGMRNEKGVGRLGDGASRVTGRWEETEIKLITETPKR